VKMNENRINMTFNNYSFRQEWIQTDKKFIFFS
jgi:hypothetical protein